MQWDKQEWWFSIVFLSSTQAPCKLDVVISGQAHPLVSMTTSLSERQLNFRHQSSLNLGHRKFVFQTSCLYLWASEFQIYWSTPVVNIIFCNFCCSGEWISAELEKNKAGHVNSVAWIHSSVIDTNTCVIQFYLIETQTDCEGDKYDLSIFNISEEP